MTTQNTYQYENMSEVGLLELRKNLGVWVEKAQKNPVKIRNRGKIVATVISEDLMKAFVKFLKEEENWLKYLMLREKTEAIGDKILKQKNLKVQDLSLEEEYNLAKNA